MKISVEVRRVRAGNAGTSTDALEVQCIWSHSLLCGRTEPDTRKDMGTNSGTYIG